MTIDEILGSFVRKRLGPSINLIRPCSDHRKINKDEVFCAIKGSNFNGHNAVPELIKKGIKHFILEADPQINIPGTCYIVTSSRVAFDKLIHAYLNYPSRKLFCTGITGTNGKTTTSMLVEYALNKIGKSCGVIGTIDHHFQSHIWDTNLTSPGSEAFYNRLNDFIKLGAQALSTEVSSHALDQDRISSCEFDVAIFTNLTQDHLDYHLTMENYFLAKKKLFTELLPSSNKKKKISIINIDDGYGKKILESLDQNKMSYGQDKKADLKFQILKQELSGQTIEFEYKNEKSEMTTLLTGTFNVYNLSAAICVLLFLDYPLDNALDIFKDFTGVKGRLQKVPNDKNKHVFVDYAHTPDALLNVIKTLQVKKNNKKLITVFGCGGDRDKLKRPLMGEIACKNSDHVIITSDNPRTEAPKEIINDILKGCRDFSNYSIIEDRRHAILKSIEMANSGDAVLIAGKGHEDYQIVGEVKTHFSDYDISKEILDG